MMRHNRKARQGAVLVCVIACLVVASTLVGLAVQASLRGRREARLQLQLRQTELLCEAGVMRAVKRLQTSTAGYAGERWTPELHLENYHDAVVEIQIANAGQDAKPSQASAKNVTVIARLDSYLDQDGPMQRSHSFTVQIPSLSISAENK